MSGSTSREQKKNLRKLLGADIADALEVQRTDVQSVHNAQRVLARQMQEFEREVAITRQSRAEDKKQFGSRLDDTVEQAEAAALRVCKDSDDALTELRGQLAAVSARADRLEAWFIREARRTRWQRFWFFVGLGPFVGRRPTTLSAPCQRPPTGWRCTRPARHEGPCAAVPAEIISDPTPAQREEFFAPATYESKDGGPLTRVAP